MKVYVLDANAIVRYMNHGPDWEKVKVLFVRTRNDEAKLFISAVNWGEVVYTLAKYIGLNTTLAEMKILGSVIETVPVDEESAREAATVKHNFKLSYGDSFAATLAFRLNAMLVTADPEFAKLGRKLKVLQLTPHRG